jgi:hypothetical protein
MGYGFTLASTSQTSGSNEKLRCDHENCASDRSGERQLRRNNSNVYTHSSSTILPARTSRSGRLSDSSRPSTSELSLALSHRLRLSRIESQTPLAPCIHVYAVIATLTQELGTMTFQMADQVDPLHEIRASGSRMTGLSRKVSSTSARFVSKTS